VPDGEPGFDPDEVLARLPALPTAGGVPDDVELAELFRADQADRTGGDVTEGAGRRDRQRRARILRILTATGACRTARDRYHAAMVLQHGDRPEHFALAHGLCRQAAGAGVVEARWLAAASLDRWLMSTGRPQRFGTQYLDLGSGWVHHEVDPATTDAERSRWDVPSLAELRARVDRMNAAEGAGS
jgi:hypothetical protein